MILLDTDVVSHLLRRGGGPRLLPTLRQVPVWRQFISAISVGEILYGIERSGRHEETRARFEAEIIGRMQVLPFDLEAARVYAATKAELHRSGQPLDEPDLRIAAIALSRDLTVVTGNEAHFRRIVGLRVGNWLRE